MDKLAVRVINCKRYQICQSFPPPSIYAIRMVLFKTLCIMQIVVVLHVHVLVNTFYYCKICDTSDTYVAIDNTSMHDNCINTSVTILHIAIYVSFHRCIVPSMYHSIDVSFHLCIIPSMYRSIYVCIIPSMYHSIYVSFHRCIIPSMYHSIYVSFHRCIVPSMYHSIDVSFHQCIVPSMYCSIYVCIVISFHL